MSEKYTNAIVTITDSNYVIPAYILVLSLIYYKVKASIVVLGVNLSASEIALFNQFPNTTVVKGDTLNKRNAATRKAEAILAASGEEIESISLFDADCIITGDITPYLSKGLIGLSARLKTKEEDSLNFSSKYSNVDAYGTIPIAILEQWKEDVGEKNTPAIKNTICGGNLTFKSDQMVFVQQWHDQMMKIIENTDTKMAYDWKSFAYFQLDESVLNSLLAFSDNAPALSPGWFDKDPNAILVHLGPCNPRYWRFWRLDRIKYYPDVIGLLRWAENQKHISPDLPWSINGKHTYLVYAVAYGFEATVIVKRHLKRILKGKA